MVIKSLKNNKEPQISSSHKVSTTKFANNMTIDADQTASIITVGRGRHRGTTLLARDSMKSIVGKH